MSIVRIPLTQGQYATIDEADFGRASMFKWHFHRRKYAATKMPGGKGGTRVLMHRFLMDAPDGIEVDHINGDGLDNRRSENLRLATHAQNMRNRSMHRNNRSGYKGVHWKKDKQRWCASIRFNRRTIFIGYFDDPKVAARSYDRKASALFGQFAHLNFPT